MSISTHSAIVRFGFHGRDKRTEHKEEQPIHFSPLATQVAAHESVPLHDLFAPGSSKLAIGNRLTPSMIEESKYFHWGLIPEHVTLRSLPVSNNPSIAVVLERNVTEGKDSPTYSVSPVGDTQVRINDQIQPLSGALINPVNLGDVIHLPNHIDLTV